MPDKNKRKLKIKVQKRKEFSFLYSPGETNFQTWKRIRGKEIIKAQYAHILIGTMKVAASFVEIINPFNETN